MRASATSSVYRFSADEAVADVFRRKFAMAASREFGYTDGYTPSAKQAQLHVSTSANLLYGGAAGGGKSRGFREDIRRFCLSPEAAGQNVLLLRRTFPELLGNHWRPARREWYHDGCVFNASEHTVTWPNGCLLIMGHCQHEKDVDKHLGQEYARIYFDELTTFCEYMYDMICGRLRTTRPGLIPRAIAGTNPGGIGHAWVKARWIDRQAVDDDGIPRDLAGYDFIQSKLSDNPLIDTPEYRKRLEGLPPAKRKAYMEGLWDLFEGQYFPEWSRDVHVCEPFAVPESWPRWRVTDYGSTAPWATGWYAGDPATSPMRFYKYREYYKAGALLRDNSEEVVRLSQGERYKASLADPSMKGGTTDERGSLLDQAKRAGLVMAEAFNDRLAGWQCLHELLRHAPDGPPRLVYFATCHNSIRTLPGLIHDARRVEDLDTTGEDHTADCDRYFAAEVTGKRRMTKPVVGGQRRAMVAGSRYSNL